MSRTRASSPIPIPQSIPIDADGYVQNSAYLAFRPAFQFMHENFRPIPSGASLQPEQFSNLDFSIPSTSRSTTSALTQALQAEQSMPSGSSVRAPASLEDEIQIVQPRETLEREKPIKKSAKFSRPKLTDFEKGLDENTPLLDKDKQETKNLLEELIQSLRDFIEDIKNHKIASFIALLSIGQPGINALLNESHASPEALKEAQEWFDSLTLAIKILSILEAISSLLVNFPLSKEFIQEATHRLKNALGDCKNAPVENTISIFLGIFSAIAAGVLTYSAYSWIPARLILPEILTTINVLITSASRYLGVKRAYGLIKDVFNEDRKIQKRAVDAINHINPEFKLKIDLAVINSLIDNLTELESATVAEKNSFATEVLREANHLNSSSELYSTHDIIQAILNVSADDKLLALQQALKQKDGNNEYNAEFEKKLLTVKLTDKDYEELFKTIIQVLRNLENHTTSTALFTQKTYRDYTQDYGSSVINVATAAYFGGAAGTLFAKKGEDGVNNIVQFLGGTNKIGYWAGVPAGIGSGLLYGTSAAEYPKALWDFFWKTFSSPRSFIFGVGYLGMNVLAATSLKNVADTLVETENLGFWNAVPNLFAYTNGIGSLIVNSKGPMQRWARKPMADFNRPSVEELTNHFSTTHKISTENAHLTAVYLDHLSFFRPLPTATHLPVPESINMTEEDFSYMPVI